MNLYIHVVPEEFDFFATCKLQRPIKEEFHKINEIALK